MSASSFTSAGELWTTRLLLACLLVSATGACKRDDSVSCDGDPPGVTRPDTWTRRSHCRGVAPDYDEVFDDGVLHEFRISVSSADYKAMMDDMDEKFSGSSTSMPDLDALPAPIWVPATVRYGGRMWTGVGMRWKGHASLKGAWNSGIRKLSFLLTFDYFEDSRPEILDQRFFGFKKLVFSNAYNDPSLIREKVAAEVFRAAGVPVARSAFAPIYLDWGKGSVYLGLYAMIEDPSDAMLDVQFGDGDTEDGNLYKPWGDAARWLGEDDVDGGPGGWQKDVESHFEKGTDALPADWSDIEAVVEKLHRERNVPAQWRADLEEDFDVRSFIKTLAANQVIMNWDSYGCMHHNYYLYSNPADHGRFVWFPWDLNEAMLYREKDGCPEPGSVMLDEIVNGDENDAEYDTNWPLIRFVLRDSVYLAAYKDELRAVLGGPFAQKTVVAMMRKYHDLVAPYVVGPDAVERFPYTNTTANGFKGSLTDGNDALVPHVAARRAAVKAALEE
jgi:spore coat protein H